MRSSALLCLALAGALFAGATGCVHRVSPRGQQLLESGYDHCQAGQYRQTVDKMDRFLALHPRSREAAWAYYLRGLSKYMLGDNASARADLSEAVARCDHPELEAKACKTLGDLAFEQDDYPLAEKMYRRGLASGSGPPELRAQAQYRLGQVLQRRGKWSQADIEFNHLIYDHAQTPAARRAERLVNAQAWTIQVGAFADRRRAMARMDELRQSSMDAVVRPTRPNGAPFFAVQIGRFETYRQAVEQLAAARKLQPDAFVVTTR